MQVDAAWFGNIVQTALLVGIIIAQYVRTSNRLMAIETRLQVADELRKERAEDRRRELEEVARCVLREHEADCYARREADPFHDHSKVITVPITPPQRGKK